VLIETKNRKTMVTWNYISTFNKNTGHFVRLIDPGYCKFGPEILDIEITQGGNCLGKCDFCYKCNNVASPIHNMSFEVFKCILDKIGKQLTQVAFGITDVYANPDFFKMISYCREQGIIPNYTTHGLDMDDFAAENTKQLCGAVAVSIDIRDKAKTKQAMQAIHLLNKHGMTNVNIHYMLSEETYKLIPILVALLRHTECKFKAIVFLQFKNKNNISTYHSVTKPLVYQMIKLWSGVFGFNYGFDSCSSSSYLNALNKTEYVSDSARQKELKRQNLYIESCESTIFSSYINSKGEFYPCSFSETGKGLDVIGCKDFRKDIWEHPTTVEFRNKLLASTKKGTIDCIKDCRLCPVYPEINAW